MLDERHWPARLQERKPDSGAAAQNQAADFLARDKNGQPVGLSLEKLHITFADNLYDTPDGQALFNWGTAWRRHTYYPTLAAAHQELGLETGSRQAPFAFGDYLTRDFRVPAKSPALKMGCYPRGDVPDVQLGLLPKGL